MTRLLLLVTTGCWLVNLCGCTTYAAPEVRVLAAASDQRTANAVTLDFDLLMINPNDEPLDLRWVEYDLAIDGRTVYTGKHAVQSTLPARDIAIARIPAVVPFDRLDNTMTLSEPELANWSLDGSLVYITPDELIQILTDSRIFYPRAGFRATPDTLYTETDP